MQIVEPNQVIRADLDDIIGYELPWQCLQKKVVMITGGSGFLASYMVKSLICANDLYGLGLEIICVVRSLRSVKQRLLPYIDHPHLKIIKHDISRSLPEDFPGADLIIHNASQASPRLYGVDPVGTLMANTAGTAYLLDHAVRHRSSHFLFFSTAEVYGDTGTPGHRLTENSYGYLDPLTVRSCYAESKRIGETMCAAWSHQHGVHTSIVRPFHTYGPGMALDDGRVFADFVGDVVSGRDIVIKSNGLATRSFCYIADATKGFLSVLLKGKTAEAYNIANPKTEISMRDLAHAIAGLFPEREVGVRFDVSASTNAYLQSPVPHATPSIEKVSQLGWTPTISISEGFARTVQSFL
jgi:nucleoside-diphosphate-sugar epimerase